MTGSFGGFVGRRKADPRHSSHRQKKETKGNEPFTVRKKRKAGKTVRGSVVENVLRGNGGENVTYSVSNAYPRLDEKKKNVLCSVPDNGFLHPRGKKSGISLIQGGGKGAVHKRSKRKTFEHYEEKESQLGACREKEAR